MGIIKDTSKHIIEAWKPTALSNHTWDEYKTRQAILEQAIRSNRNNEHILQLSRELDDVVVSIMRG